MLSCCLLVYAAINCIPLSTFLSFWFIFLYLFSSPTLLIYPSISLPFPAFPLLSLSPIFPLFLTLCFSDWRLQIATEFHHKTPLCSYCPCCLLTNTQRNAGTHATPMLTCHQNLLFRLTINKSMSKAIREKRGLRKKSHRKKIGSFLFAKRGKNIYWSVWCTQINRSTRSRRGR